MLHAAMRQVPRPGDIGWGDGRVTGRRWVLAGAAVLVVPAATGGAVALSGARQPSSATQAPPAATATVEKGELSAAVSRMGP